MELDIRGAEADADACVLLPHDDYPGSTPPLVNGEMQLSEMEDDTTTVSQIFLNDDGTVEYGATDGPPPLGVCGLWQCGESGFQMTLTRTFSASPSTLPVGAVGGMNDDLSYSVTRIYLGEVNPNSTGPSCVQGRMELYTEEAKIAAFEEVGARSDLNQWSGEVLSSGAMNPPIGYFELDGNIGAELEPADGA